MGEALSILLDFISSNFWQLFLGALFFLLFRSLLSERALPKAHSIAIIGEERAGKTTLVTTLFDELFSHKVQGIKAVPRGRSTIERINSDLEKLQQGKALGPTQDQDIFAYRTNLTVGTSLFKRVYKVEIADFAGKRSTELAEQQTPWLHDTEFFKWVLEADAFVFSIDLAKYLIAENNGGDYISHVSAVIRAAWQHIVDSYDDSPIIRRKPLVLVFTKADVFTITTRPTTSPELRKRIEQFALGDTVPRQQIKLDEQSIEIRVTEISAAFNDLIVYMKGLSTSFSVQFVSGFGVVGNKRLNYSKLITFLLPRVYDSNIFGRVIIRSLRSLFGIAQDNTGGTSID